MGPKVESVCVGDFIIFEPAHAKDVFFDNPNKTHFTVVVEAGVYARLSSAAAKELELEIPQLDILDVLSRTVATAVPA